MRYPILLLLALFVLVAPAFAQQASIELGKSPLPINQYFTVSVKLQDEPLTDITAFPEIEGFKKSTKFSSTKTMIVGGNLTVVLTVTQNYAALDEGTYTLKPFSIRVNGKVIQSSGTVINVVAMAENAPQSSNLPDLVTPEAEVDLAEGQPEYIDKDDNAFLTLYTSKDEIFVGEGVSVTLFFYLANEDQRLLDFHDFANQINNILRQLKQPHVWEETFDFAEVVPENVLVEGKPYLRFRLYEAVFYPLTAKPIRFPKLSLQMIKYKVAASPNLLEDDRQEGFKTYFARPREVRVKDLPPHPLRDVVPVGRYRLSEALAQSEIEVNSSFIYRFQLIGEGNLVAVMAPLPQTPPGLDTYPPDVQQDVTRRDGRVFGSKTFSYTFMPREPGTYEFSEMFNWIYFDPVAAKYDTLQPKMQVTITGSRDDNALVMSRDLGTFYNIINNEDANLVKLNQFEETKRYTNIILGLLLVVATFIFIKRRNV